ncbi:MAG: hypothetical protein Q8Q36_00880 [bacterium]|nr:hypothetical protein [bacterium]
MDHVLARASVAASLVSRIKEEGPYPPSQKFERFIGFLAGRLPPVDAEALKKEWEKKREEVRLWVAELFSEVALCASDKEELGYIILCDFAKEEVPGWWHFFEEKLSVLH